MPIDDRLRLLASEWLEKENLPARFEDFTRGSKKKFWWQCNLRHEWEASLSSRLQGSGCPFCAGVKILPGFNDLATRNPELALEWSDKNTFGSASVSSGSKKVVWWKCLNQHEWQANIFVRSTQGYGCPICSNKKLLTGDNDLASQFPEVAVQWHPTLNEQLTPEQARCNSTQKAWWQCQHRHEWQASIRRRTIGDSGCPVCCGRLVHTGINDLATQHPEIAIQWDTERNDKPASQIYWNTEKQAWWKCPEGHSWQKHVNRAISYNDCPYCSGYKAIVGVNDITTTHPELSEQWHPTKNVGILPSNFTYRNSTRRVWWLGTCGHEWDASPRSRAHDNGGCPVCRGRRVLLGSNDLAFLRPEIASEWHPTLNKELLPTQVTAGSDKKVWWKCLNGHEWQASVTGRNRGRGCGRCAFNDGASKSEKELAEWIESLGISVHRNTRSVINPHELDIYLPDYNFAIEYNGLYWHSEAAGKDRNYHKDKVELAQAASTTLFQVWEDDWRDCEEIIKRMILHRLGLSQERVVFARKTKVTVLTTLQAHSFLEVNHLQGKANGGLYLGLVSEGALVACMALKCMPGGLVYLERYATSCRVPGGFTRLLKHAIKTLEPVKIITFADQSISEGNLYEKNGFTVDGVLAPDYSYLVKGKRVHKFNYRLKRFREDSNLQYQEGLSESQLAALNKLRRIWDSGKTRYVLSL